MANPVESGPRCLRLLSIAVISLPTPVAPSRWMSPAIPHIIVVLPFSALPLRYLSAFLALPPVTWAPLARRLLRQAVEISLGIPFGHGVQETLPLIALIFVIEA